MLAAQRLAAYCTDISLILNCCLLTLTLALALTLANISPKALHRSTICRSTSSPIFVLPNLRKVYYMN